MFTNDLDQLRANHVADIVDVSREGFCLQCATLVFWRRFVTSANNILYDR
jgi:hypothetical protein